MLFQRTDWTLFRSLDTLGQRAGVPRQRIGAIVAKELADNALDSGAKTVKVGRTGANSFFVEDDGAGIPGSDEQVASLFSISRPLTSSKLLRLPTRGALGNGLRVVAGAVLASGGSMVVRTRGRTLKLVPSFHDGRTAYHELGRSSEDGTRVEVTLGAEIQIDLSLAELAVAMRGERSYRGKTSAHWYSLAAFRELVSAAPPGEPLGKLLREFDLPAAKLERYDMKPVLMGKLSDAEVESTYRFLLGNTKAPRPAALGAVGRAGPHDSYAKEQAVVTCGGANLPCVVEVWAKQTEVYGEVTVMVNRTPVVSQIRHRTTKNGTKPAGALHGCGLHHFVATGKQAFDATINIQIPYMAVTNDGKEPNLEPLAPLILGAFEKACRKAKVTTQRIPGGGRAASKRAAIAAALDGAIAKASGGGKYRYSLRQLYYATRPIVGTDLDYNYFSSVIADIESDRGTDLPGIYRDARGQLYEPHTGRTIALGTLAVEQYERKRGRVPTASYVSDRDRDWLQERRIELNAMTSPQFLEWLDEKFARHATVASKVVPGAEELREHALELARDALRKRAVDRLLREHVGRIENELSDSLESLKIDVSEVDVLDALGRRPEDGWRDVVAARVLKELQ